MSNDNPMRYSYGIDNIQLRYSSPHAHLHIGKFCSIGQRITIYLGGNHDAQRITTYPFGHIHTQTFNSVNGDGHPTTKGDVVIGNDVWIADDVRIMSGVKIGDGAIIANNSHVVKDVEPYSIVGGNPARFIRYRFTPEQITALQRIQWWNWEESKINEALPKLCSHNIDDFISEYSPPDYDSAHAADAEIRDE